MSIRTFWRDGATVRFGTGAGITWGSDAQREWDETELKASRLIALAAGRWPLPTAPDREAPQNSSMGSRV